MMEESSPVLYSCENGWAYNHCKAISQSVLGSGFKCPVSLFHIPHPYFSVSKNAEPEENAGVGKTVNIKKRKRARGMVDPHTDKDRPIVEHEGSLAEEAKKIIKQVQNMLSNCWIDDSAAVVTNGNRIIINDPVDYVSLSNLAMQCNVEGSFERQDTEQLDSAKAVTDIVSKVVENSTRSCILINTLGTKFIIPPFSTFLMSDIKEVGKLLNLSHKYGLIVIDPPWTNKSVKRAKTYTSLSFNNIKTLPIPSIVSSNSVVAVWVTNKKKIIDFVKEELFPVWSLQLIGEWHWIKVTMSGEFVCDFHSTHKKPYECLLIGCYNKSVVTDHFEPNEKFNSFPFNKIICSVPCKQHSRKPILYDFLKSHLDTDSKCLELFARNLLPGWTSWGNEVIKYQNIIYFDNFEVHH